MSIRTVLFDLDGTLADTGPDLADALNEVLREQQRTPLPYTHIRPMVSHGGTALLQLGFPELAIESEIFLDLRHRFMAIYRDNLTRRTQLFPGTGTLLDTLERRGMNWGVVTNKPAWLTDPLMEQMGLSQRAACIVSGDTTKHRKPHPEPMLFACAQAGSAAQQCLYVGDAQRDITAGRTAGMTTLVARYGYIGANDDPESWGAHGLIDTPMDILQWIEHDTVLPSQVF